MALVMWHLTLFFLTMSHVYSCTTNATIPNSNVSSTGTQCTGSLGDRCPYHCDAGYVAIGDHVCQTYVAGGHVYLNQTWFGGNCHPLCNKEGALGQDCPFKLRWRNQSSAVQWYVAPQPRVVHTLLHAVTQIFTALKRRALIRSSACSSMLRGVLMNCTGLHGLMFQVCTRTTSTSFLAPSALWQPLV